MADNYVISERKKDILISAVESYIDSALPITSGSVKEIKFPELSSATLRNELNALEEMGFLKQLHTSGGRIPTAKAYRLYVNELMNEVTLDKTQIDDIKDTFLHRSAYLKDVLTEMCKKINEITSLPTFVMVKGYDDLVLQGINIIPLLTGQALVLFQTNAGIINNTITLKNGVTEDNCKDASKFLTNSLFNKTIKDIFEHIDEYNELFSNQLSYYDDLFISITNVLKDYIDKSSSGIIKNVNTSKLLTHKEFKDIDSTKKLLSVIENEEDIKQIISNIDENSSNDVVITIGDENNNQNLNDYSIVRANYTMSSGVVTSIGVLGPERMDYPKIASALKFIISEMKNLDDKGE